MTGEGREPARRPEVIASRRVHDGWVGLRVDTLRYTNGHEGTIDLVEHPGGITLVAFDPEDRLLIVRQYRHPAERELLELPAGTLDGNEAPEVCAERELQEETGYKPGSLERLGGFYLAPGYCSEYQEPPAGRPERGDRPARAAARGSAAPRRCGRDRGRKDGRRAVALPAAGEFGVVTLTQGRGAIYREAMRLAEWWQQLEQSALFQRMREWWQRIAFLEDVLGVWDRIPRLVKAGGRLVAYYLLV